MPVAMIVEIPEGDAEFYDAVMEALDWDNSEKPAGFISHLAGPSPNGWTVIDVWESKADFDNFAQSRLGPALAEAAGGEAPSVEPTFIPVHNMDRATAGV